MNAWHLPKLPLGEWIEAAIDWLVATLSVVTAALSRAIEATVEGFTNFILFYPAPLMIAVFAFCAWWLTDRLRIAAFILLGLGLAWNLRMWDSTIYTLALVLLATAVAVAIGMPLGILASVSRAFWTILLPVLDFMQTLPPFVYLIPALALFGLGATSAEFATVIFSIPPAIRLTTLGIRQVPGELVEAADAFGSTTWQKLVKLQIPLAAPSIRQGVNQTIMLSLSMVVIAAMIGAKGLGADVWRAIQRNDVGLGFEAGICIVILAIVLDRVMQATGQGRSAGRR